MRFLLFYILISQCLTGTVYAQDIRISGEVSSALSGKGVARAVVKLMTADKTSVLATDTTRYRMITEKGDHFTEIRPDKQSGATFSLVATNRKEYILTVEADGFEEYACKVVSDAGKSKINVSAIHLIPRRKDIQLNEAVVKTTRIKMFYKGDTLIYNADAFNVEQSQSLRKLVEQLPGSEMKDGEIRINGKRIENLLLSGKDFFNGNIQTALDNLPAYIVGRIKVYNKAGEESELTGRDMHDESYVMDVRLKRQYIGMWMAKFSADGGIKNLWGGQGYLMRFDDRQMFTVNADINNFNEDRQMSEMGDGSDFLPWGQIKSKTIRFSYYIEPNSVWRFKADGSVNRKDTDKKSWQNEETYFSPNNLMTRRDNNYEGEDIKASAQTSIRVRKKGSWQHSLSYNFDFERSKSSHDAHSISYYLPAKAIFENLSLDSIIKFEEANAEEHTLLNSLVNPQLSHLRSFTHNPKWESSFVLGSDLINFCTNFKHDIQTQKDFSNYRLTTYAGNKTDARRWYQYSRDYVLEVSPEIEWVHKYERIKRFDGVIKPFLRYTHHYGTANHPYFRLDRMTEWSEQLGWGLESLGQLPLSDWQSICLDEANSYYSLEKENKSEAGATWSHKIYSKNGTLLKFEANTSVCYQHKMLDYNRENLDYHPQRKAFFFQPNLSIKWEHESRDGRVWMPEWDINYRGIPSMPTLMLLLPIRNSSDPLNIFIGNEQLGNPFAHQLGLAYRLQHIKSGRSFNISTTYRRLHNDIATQSFFDATTGVRTYQPINTSRTHSVQGKTEFSTSLDKKKHFYLSASLSADYYQCENLSYLVDKTTTTAGLLRNIGFTPSLTLRGTVGNDFRIYARWNTTLRHVSQPGVTDNYRETTLYGDIGYSFPWGIQFNTIIRTTLYAGNSLEHLNRTTTYWDTKLSKYIIDERLGFHLRVHDILNQATTYR
ncbi:MAG: outer membrane beta-barrel protein, partial [Bacteroidaceae bacterium]